MSIKSLFTDIASAIKEKNTDIVTVSPANMPAAIRAISTGVPLYTSSEWDALTTEEKQALALVAIQQTDSGFERGILVNGADFTESFFDKIVRISFKGYNPTTSKKVYIPRVRFFNDSADYCDIKNNISNITYSGVAQSNPDYILSFTSVSNLNALFNINELTNDTCYLVSTSQTYQYNTINYFFDSFISLTAYNNIDIYTNSYNGGYTSSAYNSDALIAGITIEFENMSGETKTLNVGNLSTHLISSLGYSNNNYQNEVE